jgi:hypothetical protein
LAPRLHKKNHISNVQQPTPMLNQLKSGARSAANSIGEKMNEVAPDASAKLTQLKKEAKGKATTTIAAVKSKGTDVAVDQINALASKILHDVVTPKLSDSLGEDPDMPQVVRDSIGFAVEEIMTEVEENIHDKVEEALKGTIVSMREKIEAPPYACCCPNPFTWSRALLLYTLFPHDKSIWANIRSPVWWVVKIISVFPVYYISTLFFALIWLLKSKKDEYQLINFIVALKQAHFISYGLLGSILGNVGFIQCAILHPHENPTVYHHPGGMNDTQPDLPCSTSGPGLDLPFWPTALIFVLQIVLTWASAAFLPCSKRLGDRGNQARAKERQAKKILKLRKAGQNDEADVMERKQHKTASKIVRIKYWLVYDSCCCLLIAVLCVMAAMGSGAMDAGPTNIPSLLHITMWWCRILYGLLCVPWMFLQGFLYPLILHTKSTAYNARGQVVPLANANEKKRAWNRRHPNRVVPWV